MPQTQKPQCAECRSLAGANVSASPHANLLLHSESAINFGATATGVVQYYVCHRCGATWARELARSEPGAVWKPADKPLA